MINGNKNEAANEKLDHTDRHKPRPRYRHKYAKYEICLRLMMVICIKQNLGNI